MRSQKQKKNAALKLRNTLKRVGMKIGFTELQQHKSNFVSNTVKSKMAHIESQMRAFDNKHKEINQAIEHLNKLKASRQDLDDLERSVDKNRAITLYNDMQLYVDETMNQFYQKLICKFSDFV